MEFKENLKQLRMKKGLTQAQLAEKLFVSRSTVAKWENGLGLPNPESMTALEKLFDIGASELATKEPEKTIVKKNQKLWRIGQIVGWSTILVLLVAMIYLPFAIHNGKYGFTPDMAAGSYADDAYIDTGDYRIYYFTFEGDFDDGRHWSDLQGFRPVKKHFWGCTVSEDDYTYKVFTKSNCVAGRLYTIKGENGYYNLIKKAGHYKADDNRTSMIWDIPPELITATAVMIAGEEHELQGGFFFITNEPVKYFKIGDEWYDVE
ncbi:MAG: helix-turn-helix transcriptional regulator [Ruminococcaceae bacterium]|nr:helix-turn-helix transcriptional regulator [Oscillospiraceae bacterium]